MTQPPHIVIFNPDQWRGDVLGHMGNPAAVTPNLDALVATEAVSFRRAFCQNTVCTPSRCSFMTGWYPHVAGHRTMHHMLRPHEPCLLKTLKDNGYFVWWGGKNDLVPAQNGYDKYCNVMHRPTEADFARWGHTMQPGLHSWTDWRGEPGSDTYYSFFAGKLDTGGDSVYFDGDYAHVLGAVDLIRSAPADKPLCIYLPLGSPHPPYGVEEPWFSRIDRAKLPPRIPAPADWSGKPSLVRGIHEGIGMSGWTEDRWTELRATYYGMCARMDHLLGLVVAALRDRGLWDDTALFVFSDHGDFTGDYGLVEKTQNTDEDCLTRVPFVIKPPRSVPVAPRVSEAMVELIDFPATVEDFTGIAPGHTHFGRSLRGVLSGQTDEHRDAVFCEGGRLADERHCTERQAGDLVLDPAGLYYVRGNLQQSWGPEHTKAVMCRTRDYKYVMRLGESDELYDLRSDPGEEHNRIDDPSLAATRQTLRDRLLRFFLETADVVPFDADRRW